MSKLHLLLKCLNLGFVKHSSGAVDFLYQFPFFLKVFVGNATQLDPSFGKEFEGLALTGHERNFLRKVEDVRRCFLSEKFGRRTVRLFPHPPVRAQALRAESRANASNAFSSNVLSSPGG